jgi:uncharacterized membrane protein
MIAAELVAHGGTGGLIVEGALLLGLLVLVFVVCGEASGVRYIRTRTDAGLASSPTSTIAEHPLPRLIE